MFIADSILHLELVVCRILSWLGVQTVDEPASGPGRVVPGHASPSLG